MGLLPSCMVLKVEVGRVLVAGLHVVVLDVDPLVPAADRLVGLPVGFLVDLLEDHLVAHCDHHDLRDLSLAFHHAHLLYHPHVH